MIGTAALCSWISSVPASKSGRVGSLARGQGHTCSSRLFRSQYRCMSLPFWIAPATRFLGTTRVRVLCRMILPGASPAARAASTLHAQLQRAGLSLLAQHAARARRLELARAARGRRVNAARSSLHALVCTRGFNATSVRSRMQAGMMLLPASSAWCLGLNAI